ncbi:MAG: RNA polymerase factor sigma-54 [Candidatus Brocadiales bacterium]|nr:RNA polymerase factor sigma-54 [Candidatus Brocadiales bacterium]
MEISLQPQLQQKLKLAPQIIQSIEILQLPLLALLEHVQMELEENPVLEEVMEQEKGEEEAVQETEKEEEVDILPEEWQPSLRSRARRYEERDQKQEALENTSAKPISFHEYLLGQLSLMEVPQSLKEACENIIYHLDDNGYLTTPLEEVMKGLEKPISLQGAREALRLVQSMEPQGMGARNLEECLLLQLDKRDEDYELAKEIITHHLKDVEMKRYPQIAKKTGKGLETIKRVVELISSLNPRPGSLFSSELITYVVPDVRVEYIDGRYEITLNEDYTLPHLSINKYYRHYLNQKGVDAQTRQFVRKKMESARWLMDAIEQRRATLYKVAVKLVELQKGFFEEGVSSLRPLKMQELADLLGIHVSTVSRALARKYMQTPRGIFEMKFFFTGGFKSTEGTTESWEAMRQKMAEIIAREDKSHPLSDEDIAAMFRAKGLDIARRTVTKYRKAMKIPSSRQRRQY